MERARVVEVVRRQYDGARSWPLGIFPRTEYDTQAAGLSGILYEIEALHYIRGETFTTAYYPFPPPTSPRYSISISPTLGITDSLGLSIPGYDVSEFFQGDSFPSAVIGQFIHVDHLRHPDAPVPPTPGLASSWFTADDLATAREWAAVLLTGESPVFYLRLFDGATGLHFGDVYYGSQVPTPHYLDNDVHLFAPRVMGRGPVFREPLSSTATEIPLRPIEALKVHLLPLIEAARLEPPPPPVTEGIFGVVL